MSLSVSPPLQTMCHRVYKAIHWRAPVLRGVQAGLKKDARLKWADGRVTKEVLDEVVLKILGPFTPADEEAKKAGKGKKKPTAAAPAAASGKAPAAPTATAAAGGAGAEADAPAKNAFEGRALASSVNSARLLAEHEAVTGGCVRSRFPPEPNGFLHIGHAKSMCLNFETLFKTIGVPPEKADVTFRYDDTNPEAESMEYIENQVRHCCWEGRFTVLLKGMSRA